jgi:hypothetical protein
MPFYRFTVTLSDEIVQDEPEGALNELLRGTESAKLLFSSPLVYQNPK